MTTIKMEIKIETNKEVSKADALELLYRKLVGDVSNRVAAFEKSGHFRKRGVTTSYQFSISNNEEDSNNE